MYPPLKKHLVALTGYVLMSVTPAEVSPSLNNYSGLTKIEPRSLYRGRIMKCDKQQKELMEFSSEELSGHNSSPVDQGWL